MEKVNIKMAVAYDGTGYSGFQRQKDDITVQSVLENGLKILYDHEIKVIAAGRTDAGVHARGQVINFETSNDRIPIDKLPRALNSILPVDVAVILARKVPLEFNSRKHAKKKLYSYYTYKSPYRDPFLRNYSYHLKEWDLDYKGMREACQYFMGKHDFSAFSASGSCVKDKIREIYELSFVNTEQELNFQIIGDGFLYKMVRIIVGTLLKVGEGKINPSQIETMLDKRDKSLTGPTIPPHGLYLEKVYY